MEPPTNRTGREFLFTIGLLAVGALVQIVAQQAQANPEGLRIEMVARWRSFRANLDRFMGYEAPEDELFVQEQVAEVVDAAEGITRGAIE